VRFEQCDLGCCFWVGGVPVDESYFYDRRATHIATLMEDGKRAGNNAPVRIVECPNPEEKRGAEPAMPAEG
jgi:hypothetical protein